MAGIKIIVLEDHEGPKEYVLANDNEVNDAVAEIEAALNDPECGMDMNVNVITPIPGPDLLDYLRTYGR